MAELTDHAPQPTYATPPERDQTPSEAEIIAAFRETLGKQNPTTPTVKKCIAHVARKRAITKSRVRQILVTWAVLPYFRRPPSPETIEQARATRKAQQVVPARRKGEDSIDRSLTELAAVEQLLKQIRRLSPGMRAVLVEAVNSRR